MLEILVVCTGNVCRSPLGEHLLRDALFGMPASVTSRGTRALREQPATAETIALAESLGIPSGSIEAHRARQLREADLDRTDLVLAMGREHRREVVELNPARMRSTFLVREIGRLAQHVYDTELYAVADAAGTDPHERFAAVLQRVAGMRGHVEPGPDDVTDPYRRTWDVYQDSAEQIAPAITQVARLVRAARGPGTATGA
jgi:protein-tyrosine phosphatase